MAPAVRSAWLLAGLMLLPALAAAKGGNPEIPGERGDALAPVDAVAGWFEAYRSRGPPTGEPLADCYVLYADCRDGIRVTVQLRDLLAAAAPLDGHLRYYYTIRFIPDQWGQPVHVDCVLNLADVAVANVNVLGPETGVGTYCRPRATGATGDAFDVASSRIHYNDRSQALALAEVAVDRAAGTLSVALVEDVLDVGPGSVFSDLHVTTYVGGAKVPDPGAYKDVADVADFGGAFVL